MDLKQYIRDIPDFPKPGIMFKDITPLLKDKKAFAASIKEMKKLLEGKKIDDILAVESRGFIFGAALAVAMGVGFIPARKPGKLPYMTLDIEYQLEYGTDKICIHSDAIQPGKNIVIIDDVLATGGTAHAAARLIEKAGGKVTAMAFLIELTFLNGRKKLQGYDIKEVLQY